MDDTCNLEIVFMHSADWTRPAASSIVIDAPYQVRIKSEEKKLESYCHWIRDNESPNDREMRMNGPLSGRLHIRKSLMHIGCRLFETGIYLNVGAFFIVWYFDKCMFGDARVTDKKWRC